MRIIHFYFFLLLSVNIYTQENYNSESYRVTLGDIESNTFVKDSTVNALVIYEEGNSYVDNREYDLITEVKTKIKLLNRKGFDKATIEIVLYNTKSRKEKVTNILATTYNSVDGEVIKTKLLEKDIFYEKYDDNHTIVKFTLPNIQINSVITYSYKLESPFMFKYKGWVFQSDIPKLYSTYKTSIPGFWLYHIKLVGTQKLSTNISELKKECIQLYSGAKADCGIGVYAMKDIPAFVEEDYMTAKDNYLSRIEYELQTFRSPDGLVKNYTKEWKDVDKELRTDKEIGKQLRKPLDIYELLDKEIIDEPDSLKKAKKIYEYVQNTYTWNNKFKIYNDVSIKDLIKNKSGNVSSINILLNNLLKECGIQVQPILLSTRNNGFPTTVFPVLSDFNYLLVQATINNKKILLDATDPYLIFGEIPFRCLNQYGRLIDFKDGSKWIDIQPKSNSSIQYMCELNLYENNKVIGNIKSRRTGYHSLRRKKSYYSDTELYLDKLENRHPSFEIGSHKVLSNGVKSNNFSETYDFEFDIESSDNLIYINPIFIKFFNDNPFKLQTRNYPIDFGYKDTYIYTLKLNLGDYYEIENLPDKLSFSLPNNKGAIGFSAITQNNYVSIVFRFDFKASIYEPEYYSSLKKYFSKIIELQSNSLITLRKK